MQKVLLLENDPFFQTLIQATLSNQYDVECAQTLQHASILLKQKKYDLFLVDILLPDGSGYDFCSLIRTDQSHSETPIIIISMLDELESKLKGFDFGADDFLPKPFHHQELLARVKSKLKKHDGHHQSTPAVPQNELYFADHKIIIDSQKVLNPQGQKIELTLSEFKLIVLFAKSPDRVLTRQQILDALWPEKINVIDRVVDAHISNLRKKLGSSGKFIKSIHGVGYSFSINSAA